MIEDYQLNLMVGIVVSGGADYDTTDLLTFMNYRHFMPWNLLRTEVSSVRDESCLRCLCSFQL